MSILDLDDIASRLRSRIAIQEPDDTPDDAGGMSRAWNTVAEVWAEVVPMSGRERLDALQLTGFVTHRIIMRYRAGITTAHRLLFGGRALNIVSVKNAEEKDYLLEILAEEGRG